MPDWLTYVLYILGVLVGVPVLAYLVAKLATYGWLDARHRFRNEHRKKPTDRRDDRAD